MPPAPYPLPGEGGHSRRTRRSHANSSASALLVTRDELQPRPEQKMPPSQPPIPLPELSNVLAELTAQSIADKVMDRFNFMLVSNHLMIYSFRWLTGCDRLVVWVS